MINILHIKNIGIIDDLVVNLREGLNVLTGETGAGKTLIVDSLNIIAGGRFSKEMMRKDSDNAFVELSINSEKEDIIVTREINSNGKNLCKINGRMVTVNELKEYMKNVIDIHGQTDNLSLMDKNYHTLYLDKFIGPEMSKLKNEYINIFNEYNLLNEKLNSNYGDDKEKQRKLDLLEYQLNEIESASLKSGEEEKLEEQRKMMMNYEKISDSLNQVDYNLNNSAIDVISDSIRSLEKIESLDEKYSSKLIELKNIYYEVQEFSRDISDMKEDMYFDEEERNNIESRLDTIYSLKRKYGNNIEEILKYKDEISTELERIKNIDKENDELRKNISSLESKMNVLCNKIDLLRNNYSVILNEKINKELEDLDMPNAKINAKIFKVDNYTSNGLSNVEFLIKTNVGDEEKALNKIASGGEMSRIMLAIKNVLSNVDEVQVLVFDEIDAGISGKAANMVGNKLKQIGKSHQVITITHLASVAAKGDNNYYIYKEVENDVTKTKIKRLNEEETIKEIARISSGEINDITISHAKELRRINVA